MKRSNIRALVLVSLAVLVVPLFSASAYATNHPQAGISVAPAQLEFNVDSKVATQTKTIEISNSYDASQRLSAELQAIDETGARLVPNGALESSFAKTLKLSATDILVPAKGNYKLQIAVDATSLSGGGHYASLVLTQRSNSVLPQGYRSAIAINLFVIKDENIRTNLKLVTTSIGSTLFSMPTSGSLTFQNLGNTHVVPRASISVYDKEELVTKAVINQSSAPLFPEGQAKYTGKFDTYKAVLLPKKLRVLTLYRIDGSDIQLSKESTFWYVPLLPIAVCMALGVALFVWRRKIWRIAKRIKSFIRSRFGRKNPKAPSPQQVSTPKASMVATGIADSELERKVSEMMEPTLEAQSQPEEQPNSTPTPAPAARSIAITFAKESVAMVGPKEEKHKAPEAPVKRAKKATVKRTSKPPKSTKKSTKKAKTTKTK